MLARLMSAALLGGTVLSARLSAGDQFGLALFGLSALPVLPIKPFVDDGRMAGFAILLWGTVWIVAMLGGLALFGVTALGWLAVFLLPANELDIRRRRQVSIATAALGVCMLIGLVTVRFGGIEVNPPERGARPALMLFPLFALAGSALLWPRSRVAR